MPKYRKIQVDIVEDQDFDEMYNDFVRLMWLLLPIALCREGRGLANVSWLKAKLFPLRNDLDERTIQDAFDWLVGRGLLVLYEVRGRWYFYMPSFQESQGPTEKETESRYPPPPPVATSVCPRPQADQVGQAAVPDLVQSNSRVTLEQLQSNSGVTPDLLQTCSGVTPELVQSNSAPTANTNTTATTKATATAAAIGAAAAEKLLLEIGVDPTQIVFYANAPPDRIEGWIAIGKQIRRRKPQFNLAGFVVSRLASGLDPPARRNEARLASSRRFIEGEFAEYIQH